MQSDLTKEVGAANNSDDDYDKVVEEVEDEKYGRKRFVVRRVQKAGVGKDAPEEEDVGIKDMMYFQRRTEDLKLDQNMGQRVNTTKDAHKSEHGGYYCELCDTHVWDSNAWLDHLNGKKHSRLIGMNNKVEKVTIGDIKAKLQSLKEAKQMRNRVFESLNDEPLQVVNIGKKSKHQSGNKNIEDSDDDEQPETVKKFKNNDEVATEQPKKKGEKAAEEKNEDAGEDDDEEEEEDPNMAMMAMLGLPTSFQASKSKR